MTDFTPIVDDSYRRYAELLLEHHQHLTAGRADGCLEAVEEEMTQLWGGLDGIQQRSLSGLSSDLNWLRRGGQVAPRAKSAVAVTPDDLSELQDARARNDWNKVLHCLRHCSAKLPAFDVAFLRATAWQALGFSQVAGAFRSFAAQLEPNNAGLTALALPLDVKASMVDRAGSVD